MTAFWLRSSLPGEIEKNPYQGCDEFSLLKSSIRTFTSVLYLLNFKLKFLQSAPRLCLSCGSIVVVEFMSWIMHLSVLTLPGVMFTMITLLPHILRLSLGHYLFISS